MPYTLGIDVGASRAAAAITRLDGPNRGAPHPVSPVSADPGQFVGRIGDDVPIVLGNRQHNAHELMATGIDRIVEQVAAHHGDRPARVTVTHPPTWGPYRIDLLREALSRVGLGDSVLVPEPVAAAVAAAARHRLDGPAPIAVYDLGGTSVTATLLRPVQGGFEIIGRSETARHPAGADFDDELVALVTAGRPDPGADWDDLMKLRQECVQAKHALSAAAEVVVSPLQVRVTRGEFEELIRPLLHQGVDVLLRALSGAGLTPDRLGAVVLVGGSARMPLVRQVLMERLRRPVLVDGAPEATVAAGAALLASRSLPEPANPVAETVVMAKITDETVVLFPMEDPDFDDEDKTEEPPARPSVETEPPDLVPAKPALAAAAPRTGGGRRRRRKASKRGLVIGIMTLLLVLACAYLVLQYFNTPIGGGL
ncbi:Hsp70 family protein [Kutzneria sp. CA-103260]|uniref:Hsp70 family protein n=1 Tax=Kutzneria sp. CA-103260 TaxID=2802641 RepID=UPI001BA942D2|nr:Hsp70 family protein [Kutzneria sp. CA-103260]QUQ67635.1 chaperone protein DnaK-like protein [Kutzneria sp. CA-103260]